MTLAANEKENILFLMRFADLWRFLREAANPFIYLCTNIDNSLKGKSIMTRVISDDAVEEKN